MDVTTAAVVSRRIGVVGVAAVAELVVAVLTGRLLGRALRHRGPDDDHAV